MDSRFCGFIKIMQFNKKTALWSICGVGVLCGVFAGMALAGDDDEAPVGIPASQLVRAINAASAAKAGNIAGVEVESEKGKTIVDVDVLATDGQKYEVTIEASTGKVLSVAVDKDDDDEKDGADAEKETNEKD